MGKSFQLIRTNPRLTTNFKIVVSSDYNLYLESFDSSKELSDDKYKHYLLSIDTMLENDVPKFYDKLPKKIAFSPKTENDVDVMYDSYDSQFDEVYYSGADEVEDTWYKEEFEYFAPLYVTKNELPSNFIIMRIDDPNIYEKTGNEYTIGTLNKNNFRDEIIEKWKCANVFDLSNQTNIGAFFDRNINNNGRFPDFSFFFDIKKYNYSKWAGLEYDSGVYRTAELFLDDKLFYENLHFDLEEFVTKGFEENGIIYPYILNLKFLFDDNPATPNEFLKYSMNRYYGFYTDSLELVKNITSYELPELKDGLIVKNNVFLDSSGNYINPFTSEYNKNDWVQVDNDIFEIRQQTNGSFKIISDKNLSEYDVSTFNSGLAIIANNSISDFGTIDQYISKDNEAENMYADLYLIEINGLYHVLKNDYTKTVGLSGETIFTNNYTIQTDYAISSNRDVLEYYKGGKDNEYHIIKGVANDGNIPLNYNIYRVKLSDVKDFDFDRINTSYSDFDYEKSDYVDTQEEKLYATEYRDNSNPQRKKLHSLNQDGQYSLMNVASEYSAGDETFELRKNDIINPLWEKNQSVCKWGYRGSSSHSDYPYKLNNSEEFGGVYNRTTNTDFKTANVKEKNLDYFYRVGNFFGIEDVPILSIPEFESNWNTEWVGDIAYFSRQTSPEVRLECVALSQHYEISYTAGISFDLIPGKKYSVYVRMSMSNYGVGSTSGAGVSPDSFSNATSNIIGEVVLDFIGTAESDTFKLFADDCTVNFYEVYIYELSERYYLNQSTNIQTNLFSFLDASDDNRFNLDYYINSDFDYFDFFFRNIMYYEDHGQLKEKPYLKYAEFGGGDNDLPATALFKGVEYKIFNVEDMVLNSPEGTEETIRNVITQGGVNFNGYKMGVILSENYQYYNFPYTESSITTDTDIIQTGYYDFTTRTIVPSGLGCDWLNSGGNLWVNCNGDDNISYTATASLIDELLDTDIHPGSTYDVTFQFSVSKYTGGSRAEWNLGFNCNSFSTPLSALIDWDDISGGHTYNLNGVTSNSDGELEIEFVLTHDDIPSNNIVANIYVTNITIDRTYETGGYGTPEFQYSYNTSINGLLDSQDKNNLHVYLNEKYKNALIIINQNIPMNIDWVSLNNVDSFGENHGLYHGETLDGESLFPVSGNTVNEYNPDNITAFNYMDSLNNLNTKGLFETYVHYNYIDVDGNYAKTQMIKFNNSTFEDLPNWDEKFPPFVIEVDGPLELSLKKNSYDRLALNKPRTNIKDKFLIFDGGAPLPQSIINEPLARDININDRDYTYRKVYHGESAYNNKDIKRFVGYYEPLFKTIPMYRPIYYWKDGENYLSVGDNYVFGDNLEQFATINELMYSKVNDEYNVLKLKDTDNDKSVYPMVDEIGLSQTERFIFLSSWDSNFFIKTLNEITYLEEFITTDIDDPETPVYGQIVDVEVTAIPLYYPGINIYGDTLGSGNLSFDLYVKNLSPTDQTFSYQMKYLSNLNSTAVLVAGTTGSLDPNETIPLPVNYNRPPEQNFGVPYYEEFTTWKVVFDILDSDNNDLDSNDNTTFNVYNNLIDFTLDNATVTDGFSAIHYVGENLNYTIDLIETNVRLRNITYIAKLYMEISGGTDVYDLLSTVNGTVTDTETISFSNVYNNIYDLDYNSVDVRKIKYEVYHEYDIETVTQTTGATYIELPGLVVNRPPEAPNLTWEYPTSEPIFEMINGGCDFIGEVYKGDIASGCTATIKNIGGPFSGTISVTFYWRADAVNIASSTVVWTDILNKNESHTFITTMGPHDPGTGDPYVTYINKDYTVKAVTNQISGSITSASEPGFNNSYPSCVL